MQVVKRVSKNEFETEVEDRVAEGYKIVSKTNTEAILSRPYWGNPFWHIVLLIFTVWWTFGIINILYIVLNLYSKSDKMIIKIKR